MVDDLNPVLTFTKREVESLLHFVEEEPDPSHVQLQANDGMESVLRKALHFYPHLITKVGELHCPYTPSRGVSVGSVVSQPAIFFIVHRGFVRFKVCERDRSHFKI